MQYCRAYYISFTRKCACVFFNENHWFNFFVLNHTPQSTQKTSNDCKWNFVYGGFSKNSLQIAIVIATIFYLYKKVIIFFFWRNLLITTVHISKCDREYELHMWNFYEVKNLNSAHIHIHLIPFMFGLTEVFHTVGLSLKTNEKWRPFVWRCVNRGPISQKISHDKYLLLLTGHKCHANALNLQLITMDLEASI